MEAVATETSAAAATSRSLTLAESFAEALRFEAEPAPGFRVFG
jgi:hypothetical protein